jgi:hypothetical protein
LLKYDLKFPGYQPSNHCIFFGNFWIYILDTLYDHPSPFLRY